MGRKKKFGRVRSKKRLSLRQSKSAKYKHSGWKLKQYPDIFKAIDYPPWIVRRDDKRFK